MCVKGLLIAKSCRQIWGYFNLHASSLPGLWIDLKSLAPSALYTSCMHAFRFSRAQLCATLWTVAHQAPLSMGFSRKEYWSGLPCHPPPGDIPYPGIKAQSLLCLTLAGRFFTTSATWEAPHNSCLCLKHTSSLPNLWDNGTVTTNNSANP